MTKKNYSKKKRGYQSFRKKSVLEISAYAFAILGFIILSGVLVKSCNEGITPIGKTDFELSSRFGDFVAGTVGTLFTFAGTLFIFLTFREQQKENDRKQFEEIYYEMIRVHRENVAQLTYMKKGQKSERDLSDRLVIKEIVDEFIECYKEVKKLLKPINVENYLTLGYINHLKTINQENGIRSKYELHFYIDFCYSVIFYGIDEEGSVIVKDKFKRKINGKILGFIIFYLQLKPKKLTGSRYDLWKKIINLDSTLLHSILFNAYEVSKNRANIKYNLEGKIILSTENSKFKKYYGGHQHRLGHYYRHLYQSFKLLDRSPLIDREKRYDYGKILRAQLSTYEQILLFVNSISSLGKKWELIRDNQDYKNDYISFYQLIKNVPGTKLLDIEYRSFYGRIRLESKEERY